jgi:hypothetical protein
MRWRVSLEPVEENGLPEIVLIAVEIAGGAVDRVAVADEAADGVGDPVAVGAVVGTADRDTKSNSMRRPRVRSRRPFFLPIGFYILVSHPFRTERGKGWATHHSYSISETPTFDCRFGALGGSGREIVRALPV